MKPLTIILFVTIASAVVLSVLFQNKIEELSTQLDDVRTNLVHTEQQLTKAKRAQKEAEREMNVAQDQSETAYVNLHKAQKALKTQRQRADRHEAASQGLKTKYDLKVAEYETFLAKTAEALAAKDKRISELETQLSAVRNKD